MSPTKYYNTNKKAHEPMIGRTVVEQKLLELGHAVCKRELFHEVTIFGRQQRHYCQVISEDIFYEQPIMTKAKAEEEEEEEEEEESTLKPDSNIDNTSDTKKTTNDREHSHSPSPTKRQKSSFNDDEYNYSKTWTDMVRDLSSKTSLMTENDHQLTCKLVTLCLLSYCAPHSTSSFTKTYACTNQDSSYNNNNHCLQRSCRKLTSSNDEALMNKSLSEEDLGIASLEEIMNNIVIQHNGLSSLQFSPLVIQNEQVSLSFWDFLYNGLRPFLASRALNPIGGGEGEVREGVKKCDYENRNYINCGADDLLHLLAMIICPEMYPSDSEMFSQRAQHFISLRRPMYFELSYSQRADVVNVLSQSLVLSQRIETSSIGNNLGGIMGGITHLRASLNRFCISAVSNHHVIDSYQTMSNIAIDTGINVIEEMKSLITRLVKVDCVQSTTRENYNCKRNQSFTSKPDKRISQRFILRCPSITKSKLVSQQQWGRFERDRESICMQCSIGALLKNLILRYNGARHYADGEFTRQTLAELTSEIATALGTMEQQSSAPNSDLLTVCTLSSLLDAATEIFYFLLNHPTTSNATETIPNEMNEQPIGTDLDEDQMLEIGMKEALFECTIQLLRSANECVVAAASSLLAVGFTYGDKQKLERFIPIIYQAIQSQFQCVKERWKYQAFQYIIKIISRISVSFAKSVLTSLIHSFNSKEFEDEKARDHILRLIVAITQMQPKAMLENVSVLLKACEDVDAISLKCKREVISIIFMCRQSFILPVENWYDYKQSAMKLLYTLEDGWSIYLLTRQAFCTGNFGIAEEAIIKRKLLNDLSSSSKSYVWYMTLLKIAHSENMLSKDGSIALPAALISIDAAVNTLGSMSSVASCSTSFQERFLLQRKDFLQLCLTLRGVCAEMRLVNVEGSLHSRTGTHQKNISRCFYMLASQYSSLYKTFGAMYCNQTRSSIRNSFVLCSFLGDVSRKIFCQVSQKSLHESHHELSLKWPKGDINNIQCKLLTKLRQELVKSFDESVKPYIRADSMIEIIDVVCKSSLSYPRGFFSFKNISPIDISILVKTLDSKDKGLKMTESESTEIKTGSSFTVVISGILPQEYFSKVSLPFSQIVAYMSIDYDERLQGNEELDEHNETQYVAHSNGYVKKEPHECPFDLLPICEHVHSDGRVIIGSKFSIPFSCEPLFEEGIYYFDINLCLREVRGGEYCIPVCEDAQGIIISCKSSS